MVLKEKTAQATEQLRASDRMMRQYRSAADKLQRELETTSQQLRMAKQRNDELVSSMAQIRSELRGAQQTALARSSGVRSTASRTSRSSLLDLTPMTPQRHLELSQTAITELERSRHRLLLLTLSLIDRARPTSLSTLDAPAAVNELTNESKEPSGSSITPAAPAQKDLTATALMSSITTSHHYTYDLSDLLLSDAQCRAIFITLLDSPMPWRTGHSDDDHDDDVQFSQLTDNEPASQESTPRDPTAVQPSQPSNETSPARLALSFAKNRLSNSGLFQLVYAMIKRIAVTSVLIFRSTNRLWLTFFSLAAPLVSLWISRTTI